MYWNAGHYLEIIPDRANRGLFPDNDRRGSVHYPAYYTATCQNEKISSHGVSFYNFFVTSIRSVDREIVHQRR